MVPSERGEGPPAPAGPWREGAPPGPPESLGRLDQVRSGEVRGFDADAGLGEVTESGTGRRFGFHAVAIADGTRTIAVGTAVCFTLRCSPVGVIEAADLVSR